MIKNCNRYKRLAVYAPKRNLFPTDHGVVLGSVSIKNIKMTNDILKNTCAVANVSFVNSTKRMACIDINPAIKAKLLIRAMR